jgi:hypothetical protein
MIAGIFGTLSKGLFEGSTDFIEYRKDLKTIRHERVPITEDTIEIVKSFNDIDERNTKKGVKQLTEEKIIETASKMTGFEYISDPEKREDFLLNIPLKKYEEFCGNYFEASQAMNIGMGGTSYNVKPPEHIVRSGPPTQWGALLRIGTLLLGTALTAVGYSYFSQRDNNEDNGNDNGDNGDNGNLENDYRDHVNGLPDYKQAALEVRGGPNDNWDADEMTNIEEALDDDPTTNMFDPSNTHEEMSEDGIEYVDRLVGYHNIHNEEKTTVEVYGIESLEKAIDFVDTRPEILDGMNKYGPDALPVLLSDKDMVEIDANPRYQELMHAIVMQAQKYFYDVKNNCWWGGWDGPTEGMMLNERLDPKEKAIMDQRWEDRDILLADGENRMMNLRSRVLNDVWFAYNAETGLQSELRDAYDTDTWIDIALRNTELCPKIREQLIDIFDDPTQGEKYKEFFTELLNDTTQVPIISRDEYRERLTEALFNFGRYKEYPNDATTRDMLIKDFVDFYGGPGNFIEERCRDYYEAILNADNEDDKNLMALTMITRDIAGHEVYVGTDVLYASFLGKNIYRAKGTSPDGLGDGKPAIVFSPEAMEAIEKIGEPITEEGTSALPVVYGVERELLKKYGANYVKIITEDGLHILYQQEEVQ